MTEPRTAALAEMDQLTAAAMDHPSVRVALAATAVHQPYLYEHIEAAIRVGVTTGIVVARRGTGQ